MEIFFVPSFARWQDEIFFVISSRNMQYAQKILSLAASQKNEYAEQSLLSCTTQGFAAALATI